MKKAGVLIGVYEVLLVINAVAYTSWSGNYSELPRTALRLIGVALIIGGLWKSVKWAWWVAVILTGLFSLSGIAGLLVGLQAGLFAQRLHPVFDITILAAMVCTLGGAFVVLLLPSSRNMS